MRINRIHDENPWMSTSPSRVTPAKIKSQPPRTTSNHRIPLNRQSKSIPVSSRANQRQHSFHCGISKSLPIPLSTSPREEELTIRFQIQSTEHGHFEHAPLNNLIITNEGGRTSSGGFCSGEEGCWIHCYCCCCHVILLAFFYI